MVANGNLVPYEQAEAATPKYKLRYYSNKSKLM